MASCTSGNGLALQAVGLAWSHFIWALSLALAGARFCLWKVGAALHQTDRRRNRFVVSHNQPFILRDRVALPALEETIQSRMSIQKVQKATCFDTRGDTRGDTPGDVI